MAKARFRGWGFMARLKPCPSGSCHLQVMAANQNPQNCTANKQQSNSQFDYLSLDSITGEVVVSVFFRPTFFKTFEHAESLHISA
jgi:hypothetical protein